jgi:ribosomal protein S18 acetylase RimI-like enzyme
MRLEKRDDATYNAALTINNLSFYGIERMGAMSFKESYESSTVFIERNSVGQVVGFAIVRLSRCEPWLQVIAVHPDFRGQGYGKSLLRDIDQWAKGMNYNYIQLTVKQNNPAQKLYFDHGYRVIEVLPRYYQNEGDALLMHLDLRH